MSDSESSDDDLFAGGPVFGSKRPRGKAAVTTAQAMGDTFSALISSETERLKKKAKIQQVMEDLEEVDDSEEIKKYEASLKSSGDMVLQEKYDELVSDAVHSLTEGRASLLGARCVFKAVHAKSLKAAAVKAKLKAAVQKLPDSVQGVFASLATSSSLHLSLLTLISPDTRAVVAAHPCSAFSPLVDEFIELLAASQSAATRQALVKAVLFVHHSAQPNAATGDAPTYALQDLYDMITSVVVVSDPVPVFDEDGDDTSSTTLNPSPLPIGALTSFLTIINDVLSTPALVDETTAGDAAQPLFLLLLILSLDPAMQTLAPAATALRAATSRLLCFCHAAAIPLSPPELASLPTTPGNFATACDKDDSGGALVLYRTLLSIPLYSEILHGPAVVPGAATMRLNFAKAILESLLECKFDKYSFDESSCSGMCERGYRLGIDALTKVEASHKTNSMQKNPPKMLAVVMVVTVVVGAGITEFAKSAPTKVTRYDPYTTAANAGKVAQLAKELLARYASIKHQVTAAFSKEHLRRVKEECSLGEVRERNIAAAAEGMLGGREKVQQTLLKPKIEKEKAGEEGKENKAAENGKS